MSEPKMSGAASDRIRVANAPCSWGVIERTSGGLPPFERVLDEMAAAGYAGTELGDLGFMPSEPAPLAAALAARGLTLVGGFVPVALADPGAHADGRARALVTARLMAGAAPSPLVILSDDPGADPQRSQLAGRIRPEHGLDAAGFRALARAVDEIARAVAGEVGLRTVFHHHAASFVETPEEIERLLDLTDPETVGLCLDTGHYAYGGGDPAAAGRRLGDRIRHVHFKDCDPEVAAAARREELPYVEAVRRGVFCELGRGLVDFPDLLEGLEARGYRDWVVVEQDVLPGLGTPLESATRSRAYLRQLGL